MLPSRSSDKRTSMRVNSYVHKLRSTHTIPNSCIVVRGELEVNVLKLRILGMCMYVYIHIYMYDLIPHCAASSCLVFDSGLKKGRRRDFRYCIVVVYVAIAHTTYVCK